MTFILLSIIIMRTDDQRLQNMVPKNNNFMEAGENLVVLAFPYQIPIIIFVTGTTGGACVNSVRRNFFIEHENVPCILQTVCNLQKMCKTVYDFHGVIKHLVCSFAHSM